MKLTDDQQLDLYYALYRIVSEADKNVLETWYTGTADVRTLTALGIKYGLLKKSEAA